MDASDGWVGPHGRTLAHKQRFHLFVIRRALRLIDKKIDGPMDGMDIDTATATATAADTDTDPT